MRWRLGVLSLLFGIVVVAVFTAAGQSRPGDKEKDGGPPPRPKPYLRVGSYFRTFTGQENVQGDVTAFSGVRLKELKLGIVLLKGGKETVVDERKFMVAESNHSPPADGMVSLQFVPTGKGKARHMNW